MVKWQPLGQNQQFSSHVQRDEEGETDLSPPRKTKNHSGFSHHTKKDSHASKSSSSMRSRKNVTARGGSPPMSSRCDSPDMSPPRRRRHDSSAPNSPDLSNQRHSSPDISPPKRRKRHDSESPERGNRVSSPDLSPPRERRRNDEQSSLKKRSRWDNKMPSVQVKASAVSPTDISPPRRRRRRHDSESPERGGRVSSPDLSPPRGSSKKLGRWDSKAHSPQVRTSAGSRTDGKPTKKVGLQSAADLRQENRLARQREEEMYQKTDPAVSGRGAETVYRDKEGKKINPKLERLKQKQEEKKKMEEEEKFMEWGKGYGVSLFCTFFSCEQYLYLIHVELAHNMTNFRQEWGMGMGLVPFYSTH